MEVRWEIKDYDKGRKGKSRNRFKNFLHGIMEHNFKRKDYSTRNGTLKKAKV